MVNDVTKQVCWKQPRKFKNIVVHPGGIYIKSHLLAAFRKLMKCSALEFYVTAVYGRVSGIFNG